ncbi:MULTISPECIES: CDP-glycerol glycerophosphotransferase family protein [unclassified Vibrio]|uniref:CDP-glycerol glycerophosphotransferase family protein n=1 Tax=unclassified Vibrio TaxID=2614977 RepID=UPI000CC43555|nr:MULTISPECIES: CDP-glycerol glycerophosphotransferase family protein [unclassified Vibrio]PMK18705.1 hypothetical protein BCU05_17340 [Vibrio sp. 10N.261.54.C3]
MKINRYVKVFFGFAAYPIYILSSLMRKRENIWVFGSWYGKKYADNSKWFYEYCLSRGTDCYWITKDKDLQLKLSEKGLNSLYYLSVKGIWIQMVAGKVFITQSVSADLFAAAVSGKTKIFNLWHGVPLKKIMYDANPIKERSLAARTALTLCPYLRHRQDYLISTGSECTKLMSSAFDMAEENIIESGLPRNDAFLIKEKGIFKSNDAAKVIYMPTFRGDVGSEIDLFYCHGFDFELLELFLSRINIELYLRLHPANKPNKDFCNRVSDSNFIFFNEDDDIYDSINEYDVLITDFSSIYIDFLLSGKNVIFSPFEMDSYLKNDRSLYYNYEEATVGPYAKDWNQVMSILAAIVSSGFTISPELERLKVKFHNIDSGQASMKLFEYILELDNRED